MLTADVPVTPTVKPAATDANQISRSEQYHYLQAHGFRLLYHLISTERALGDWTDEQIAEHPKTIRAVFRGLVKAADDWYGAMMAAWKVPDERLEEFVRVMTQRDWKHLMEESGYVWDSKIANWKSSDELGTP
jgi:hypothetical protein